MHYLPNATDWKLEMWIHVSIRTGVLGFLPYMVVSNTSVRLDENFVIDNSRYGDTSDDIDHIISHGHLTSTLAKPKRIYYFDITLISELYQYDGIPLRRHVDHSVSDKYRPITLANPILMWKNISISSQQWQRYVGPMYRPIPNDINMIQFRWEHHIDHLMSEIWLQHQSQSKYAIMISFQISLFLCRLDIALDVVSI